MIELACMDREKIAVTVSGKDRVQGWISDGLDPALMHLERVQLYLSRPYWSADQYAREWQPRATWTRIGAEGQRALTDLGSFTPERGLGSRAREAIQAVDHALAALITVQAEARAALDDPQMETHGTRLKWYIPPNDFLRRVIELVAKEYEAEQAYVRARKMDPNERGGAHAAWSFDLTRFCTLYVIGAKPVSRIPGHGYITERIFHDHFAEWEPLARAQVGEALTQRLTASAEALQTAIRTTGEELRAVRSDIVGIAGALGTNLHFYNPRRNWE